MCPVLSLIDGSCFISISGGFIEKTFLPVKKASKTEHFCAVFGLKLGKEGAGCGDGLIVFSGSSGDVHHTS